MPNYRCLSVLIRTVQITAPCAIQLPLKFSSILTQCHLDEYLKGLHNPVPSPLGGKAPRAICLRLQSGLMKEQQIELRTEVLHFPYSSWQCFSPWQQHVLGDALVYATPNCLARQQGTHIWFFSRSCFYCLHCFKSWEAWRWWARHQCFFVMYLLFILPVHNC